MNKNDKIKVVPCNLCGYHCSGHKDTFKVLDVYNIGEVLSNNANIIDLNERHGGNICKTRLRKIYD